MFLFDDKSSFCKQFCLFVLSFFFKQRYLYFCLPNHSAAHSSLVRRSCRVTIATQLCMHGYLNALNSREWSFLSLHIPRIRAEGAMQIEELPGNFPAHTQRQELARERGQVGVRPRDVAIPELWRESLPEFAPCSQLFVLTGIIFHAYGWQWCAKSIWEGSLSCPRGELASLHKKASSLLYTLRPLVYSARLAPFISGYVDLEMEVDRAHGSLILLSGGEGVEMPELSTPCTCKLADLQSLPEQSHLQTLTDQVSTFFFS